VVKSFAIVLDILTSPFLLQNMPGYTSIIIGKTIGFLLVVS